MKSGEKEVNNEVNIELSEETAQGTYANLVVISHSDSEFVFDFIRMVPNVEKAQVKSRVILTPQNAKRMLAALQDNLAKYEDAFGRIEDPRDAPFIPTNFGTNPQA